MENRLIWEDQTEGIAFGADQMLKTTAFIYLWDALDQEQFEQAPEVIENAKKYGANQDEIDTVIETYLYGYEDDLEEEGDIQFNGQKRF